MLPILRDFKKWLTTREECLPPIRDGLLELFAEFITVRGVKIGGIYQNWKNKKKYEVTSVARDTDAWDRFRVHYVQIDDISHKGSRFLEEFLDDIDRPEYQGPRFTLLPDKSI